MRSSAPSRLAHSQIGTTVLGTLLGALALLASANAQAAEVIVELFPSGEDCGYTVTKDALVKHEVVCETSAGPLTLSAIEGPDHQLSGIVVVGDPAALDDAAHSALVDLILKVEDLLLEPGGSTLLLNAVQ